MSKSATTVYLWGDQPDALRRLSEEDRLPVASIIRDAIDYVVYPDGVPEDVQKVRRWSETDGKAAHASAERRKMVARVSRAAELFDQGLSVENISVVIGVSPRTVNGYLARAGKKGA